MPQATTSLRSVAVLTLLTLGQMGLQFAFQLLLAKVFGADAEMDSLVAAWTLPLAVSGLLGVSIASVFVPVFVETRQRVGETAARSMAIQVVCWLFLASVLWWLAARQFASSWMRTLHPGFDDEQVWRAAELFETLASLAIWNSLAATARAWSHCLGRFAVTGVAALVGNGVTFVFAWHWAATDGLSGAARAIVMGSLLSFVWQMPWGQFSLGWPVTNESQAAVRRCIAMLPPLLIGLACTQLDPLVDRYLASKLLPGSVSHLGYASRLAAAVLTLSTSGLAVVAFPSLAAHSAAQDKDKLRVEIAAALRFLALLLVPLVVALLGFGQPLIHDLLERGRFNAEDTKVVATLLAILCGMIVGGSLGEIASKVFYSWQRPLTPVLVGLMGFGIGVALKFDWYRRTGVSGLASATSLFYLLNAIVLLSLVGFRLGWSTFAGLPGALLRATLGSAVAAVVGWFVLKAPLPLPSLFGAAAGGAAFVVVLALLRDEFAWRAIRMLVPSRGDGAAASEEPQS
jgi:putative peptidoglycan lipid II flippase